MFRLSIDRVNAYVLHKQHLAPQSRGQEVVSVAWDTGPIKAVPTITPYISLWSRVEGFDRQQLDRALYQERALVRVPCLHTRLYIVPAERLAAYHRVATPFLQAGLGGLDEMFYQINSRAEQAAPVSIGELRRRILEVMSAGGRFTIDELAELLPALNCRVLHDPEHPELGYSRLGARLIPVMCAEGLLVRAQVRGGWRSDQYTYAPLSSWLPWLDLEGQSPETALRDVVLAYLAAFGPATVGDILHWLGDVGRQQVVAAIMSLGDELVRLEIGSSRGEYFLLKAQMPVLCDYGYSGRSVFLLPPRDSLITAYADPGRFLDESRRELVFDRAGEALGTVWVDGRITGVWWLQIREERITVRFFQPVDPEALALVGEEAQRLGRFLEFPSLGIDIGLYPEESTKDQQPSAVSATRSS